MFERISIRNVVIFWGIFAFAISTTAYGAGFDNFLVGIRGATMGAAYHGIADDASAVYYNPGGLALIDKGKLHAEAYSNFFFTKFKYSATTPVGTTDAESDEIPIIPGGFFSYSFDRLALGFGVYVPYGGGGTVYKNFFPATGDSLESSAGMLALSPSISVEIVEKYLSVGITPTIYIGMLENKLNPMDDPTGTTRVTTENTGYAGIGAALGIMSQLTPKLKIGFMMRTPVKAKIDGTMTTSNPLMPQDMERDATMEFTIPMDLTLGIGLNPIKPLTIGFSTVVLFHNMMDEMATKTTMPNPVTGEEMDVTSKQKTHYRTNVRVALGLEYMFVKQFGLRGGLQFIQSATKWQGLVPVSNDVNQLVSSLGVTWKMVDFLELDVTGMRVTGFERERETRMPVPGGGGVTIPLKETFDSDHWVLLAGLRFNMDFAK